MSSFEASTPAEPYPGAVIDGLVPPLEGDTQARALDVLNYLWAYTQLRIGQDTGETAEDPLNDELHRLVSLVEDPDERWAYGLLLPGQPSKLADQSQPAQPTVKFYKIDRSSDSNEVIEERDIPIPHDEPSLSSPELVIFHEAFADDMDKLVFMLQKNTPDQVLAGRNSAPVDSTVMMALYGHTSHDGTTTPLDWLSKNFPRRTPEQREVVNFSVAAPAFKAAANELIQTHPSSMPWHDELMSWQDELVLQADIEGMQYVLRLVSTGDEIGWVTLLTLVPSADGTKALVGNATYNYLPDPAARPEDLAQPGDFPSLDTMLAILRADTILSPKEFKALEHQSTTTPRSVA